MRKPFLNRVRLKIGWLFWAVLLITVPLTSSPIVANLIGYETPVSPLAILPAAGIVLLILIPYFLGHGKLPALVWPLFAFLLFTLISAAYSMTLPLYPFKGVTGPDRLLRGLTTLGIGLSFFLSAAIMPDNESKIKSSLRFLYLGFFGVMVWASVQAVLVLDGSERVPLVITRIHHLFSTRDPLGDRITGMAYEPSWMGDQLVILYIPFLLGSVFSGSTVFPRRWGRLSLEMIFLVWAGFILLLTQSRISLLSLLVVFVCSGLVYGFKQIGRIKSASSSRFIRRFGDWLGLGLMILLLAAIVFAAGWAISQADERMAALLSLTEGLEEFEYYHPNETIYVLANELAFAERIVYWSVGMRTFSEYPLLGVGPGNTGFFFETLLPPFGYQLTEIQNVLEQAIFGFPNPKNLWIRLLSEGGILGAGSFFVWYLLTALGALVIWQRSEGISRVVGLAGLIWAIAFFVEGFSLDTYALPQTWMVSGFVTAVFGFSFQPESA